MSISYEGTVDEKFSVVGGVTTIVKQLKYIIQSPHHARHIQADIENIPTILTPYPEDGFGNLLLKSIVPTLLKGEWLRGVWIVVLTYNDSPADIEALLVDKTLLPWERKPTNISFGSKSYTKNIGVAHPATGEGIQSKKEVVNPTITFSYNLQDFSYEWKRKFENTINSDSIRILGVTHPSGTCVLSSLNGTKEFEHASDGTKIGFYNLTVTIEDYVTGVENLVPLIGYNISGGHCHVDKDGVYGRGRWHYAMESYNSDGVTIPTYVRGGRNPDTESIRNVYDIFGDKVIIWENKPIGGKIYVSNNGQPAQYDSVIGSEYYWNYSTKDLVKWSTMAMPKEDL